MVVGTLYQELAKVSVTGRLTYEDTQGVRLRNDAANSADFADNSVPNYYFC
jgi:hypothetical protein